MDKFIGIDISKKTFDVNFIKEGKQLHQVYENQTKGFNQLLDVTTNETIVIMEASGPYYVNLANFLYEKGIRVCVVNPLKIKRFSQMNFNRAKTDKKDALVIRHYGETMRSELLLWQPEAKVIVEMKQLNTSIELLEKQKTQLFNQLEAFKSSGSNTKVLKDLLSLINMLKKKIKDMQARLYTLAKSYYGQSMDSLTSIPGIGTKTACMLISISNNFEKFTHYKQLIAYVGFSPRIYQSGSSVNGRVHICKMGKSQIRKLLYMCTLTAAKYNKACQQMYERLLERGKANRVVRIAIANKLLKQCFAIVKNKSIYQQDYSECLN